MVGKEEREVKNTKLMGLGSLVVALIIVACCPTPPTCPVVDTAACEATVTKLAGQSRALGTQVAACEATRIKGAEEARATIGALETALVTCEATPTDTVEPTECVERLVCPEAISAEHAIESVGEIRTVQGPVVDTYYCETCNGKPTFLNLCYPYEDPRRFTGLIWGEDRQEFIDCLGGNPEDVLLNRQVCVKGLIELYEGIPEIILRECDQLEIIQ